VPQPAVARIEAGAVSPRVHTLQDLLAAAGYTLEIATRLGDGVDRSLIRAALARTPEERIRAAATAARNLRTFLDATRGQHARS
jgi:predicted transcriptional regulator